MLQDQFDQFTPNPANTPAANTPLEQEPSQTSSVHLINLTHLLIKRNSCNFCSFIIRALCIPAHDPLRDEELHESILKDPKFQELRSKEVPYWVDFETWVGNRERLRIKSEAKWPFGHSYDDINMKNIEPAGGSANDRGMDFEEAEGNERLEATAISHGTKAGLAAGKHFDNNGERAKVYGWAMEVIPDMSVINAMTKKGVPATVRVVAYGISHPQSGVMDVTVFGCAKARGRDIKTLSHFNIRVASPVPSSPLMQEHLRYGRIVSRNGIDMNLCRQWLERCCSSHGVACDAPRWSATLEKPAGIPFRLIDVLDESIVEKDPQRHDYAALSYVWGDASCHAGIIVLSRENTRILSAPGSLGRFNVGQTISDAIDVVRRLGLRYLWADRLCIIQDCNTDKARQIAQMGRIYGSAIVTIVTATGKHLDTPITGVSTNRPVSQLAETVTSDPPVNVLLPMKNGPYPKLKPWASRAWTLQEKLLSKRLLIFHNGLVDFRCAHGTMHEDMNALDTGSRLPDVGWLSLTNTDLFSNVKIQAYGPINGGPQLLRSPIFADYAALIEEYTPRQMSNPADAVNAVMGLLKILLTNQQSHGRLLNGLPEEFFDQALHWQCAAKEGVELCLKKSQMFPTWSWAAWEAAAEESNEYAGEPSVTSTRPNGGVQYEATFHVQTDSRGRLQKVLHRHSSNGINANKQPQERIRPLLRWYTVTSPKTRQEEPQLRPLNSTGLGLALGPTTDMANWLDATSKALVHHSNLQQRTLPASQPSTNYWKRHLRPNYHVVLTTLVAQFALGETRLRDEILWQKRGDDGKLHASRGLKIRETFILDRDEREIGRVVLPSIAAMPQRSSCYDFILLSEAQFFGDEESIEVMGEYPLFNVIMVRWVDRDYGNGGRGSQGPRFAERIALGRITKGGWWGAGCREEVVVLG